MKYVIAAGILCLVTACNSLDPIEEQQYANLIAQGAPPVEKKNPAVAGSLNLILGFGDIYNKEWGAFALDFLLWWPSVVWAIPQGVITAGNINKKATIAYYTIGEGRNQGFDPNKMVAAPPKVLQP